MKITTRAIALAAAATMTLGGCSALGGDDADSSSSQSSGVVNGDSNANGAKAAGIDLTNPPKPIAETTLTVDGDTLDSTKIELLELRRADNVMLATFRLTGTGRGTEQMSAFGLLGSNSFAPFFVDMKNLEKYRHVEDLTSNLSQAQAPLGQPTFVFTAFPLPKEGVTEMDLRMTSASPSVDDIPMPR